MLSLYLSLSLPSLSLPGYHFHSSACSLHSSFADCGSAAEAALETQCRSVSVEENKRRDELADPSAQCHMFSPLTASSTKGDLM